MTQTSTDGVNQDDFNKLLLDGMNKTVGSLDKHNYSKDGDTKKVLGVEMDSAIANMVEVMYSTLIGGLTKIVTPKVYGTVQDLGKKYAKEHLNELNLNRVAAGTAFAVNAGIYALPSITDATQLLGKQEKAKKETVQKLATVLDDEMGAHGVSAYNRSKNEMITFHRWKTAKVNYADLSHLIIAALPKIVPNIWFHERDNIRGLRTGEGLKEIQQERLFAKVAHNYGEEIAMGERQRQYAAVKEEYTAETANLKKLREAVAPENTEELARIRQMEEEAAKNNAEKIARIKRISEDDITHEHIAENREEPEVARYIKRTKEDKNRKSNGNEGFQLDGLAGPLTSNATLTTIANKWVESSKRHLQRSFSSQYDAIDMVTALQQQLGNDPKPNSFQLPNKGKTLPLVAYVAEIMLQHARDMSDMNPEYTEIRDALKDNVIAAAKPLADAIDKGDISALALIDYIGNGKIVRNKGRLIASTEEVTAMIEHDAVKHVQHLAVDPKDFWSDAPYNAKEGKEEFASLQGEERIWATTLVPHDMRKQFGITDQESKEADAIPAKQLEKVLAELTLGAGTLSDEALHELEQASPEIKQLRDAKNQIEAKGEAAVHDLKSTPTHPIGIERILLGILVGKNKNGQKNGFAELLETGRKELKKIEHTEEKPTRSHAEAVRDSQRRSSMHEAEAYRD